MDGSWKDLMDSGRLDEAAARLSQLLDEGQDPGGLGIEIVFALQRAGDRQLSASLLDRLREKASLDLAARREAEERELAAALGDPSPAEPAPADDPGGSWPAPPWEAVAAHESPCPTWENPRLSFSGEARLLTPSQKRAVLRRDGYCCSTPSCPNRLWLATHHIVFYCLGGLTVPGNICIVCSKCHRNIHEGRLQVTGEAPGGLRWTNRGGEDLARPG